MNVLDFEYLRNCALEAGFTHAATLDASTLVLRDEVRDEIDGV